MALVRFVDGEPRLALHWAVTLWLPSGGLVMAAVMSALWLAGRLLGPLPVPVVGAVAFAGALASFAVYWTALLRVLRPPAAV